MPLTMPMLNGSGVGVRIAPVTTEDKIAYLQLESKNFEFIMSMLAREKITMGKRNVSPHMAIMLKVKEMKFSILMLVEITLSPKPNKKFIIDGTTK